MMEGRGDTAWGRTRGWLWGAALATATCVASVAPARPAAADDVIEGRARIIDGDTLEIGARRFHLAGIDAPEAEQRCQRQGKSWQCGREATYAMAALLETHWLTCWYTGTDAAGDALAECRMGGPQGPIVNEEFVRRGWALVLPSARARYAAAEAAARAAKRGMWSGSFVAPWEWRRRHAPGQTVE